MASLVGRWSASRRCVLPGAEHFRALCRAEALINGLGGGDGRVVDPPVEKQHDQHRYIEGAESAANNKFLISPYVARSGRLEGGQRG